MNRYWAWGVAAALSALAGTGGPAGAADPISADGTDTRPWYKKMFFSAPAQPGPVVRSGPVNALPGVGSVGSAVPPEVVADAMKAEYAAWERRMSVCLKLRAAAIDRNDEALMRQVDELERQIKAVREQRVSALGVPKGKAPLPAPPPTSGFAASLELAPEKSTVQESAATKLVSPGQPVPVNESASVREVKP